MPMPPSASPCVTSLLILYAFRNRFNVSGPPTVSRNASETQRVCAGIFWNGRVIL